MSGGEPVSSAPERPKDCVELLRRPISSDGKFPNYHGWELDHGQRQRFFVDGMRWFQLNSGIHRAGILASYGERATEFARKHTIWPQMLNSGNHWDSCSEVQFRNARGVKPVFYQKASLVILACELAIRDRIENGLPHTPGLVPSDVYKNMGIIPSCCHIDDFSKSVFDALEKIPNAINAIRDTAGQLERGFLKHLATGYTVTFETATAVKKFLDENHPELGVGGVNASPTNSLGNKQASDVQHIDAA